MWGAWGVASTFLERPAEAGGSGGSARLRVRKRIVQTAIVWGDASLPLTKISHFLQANLRVVPWDGYLKYYAPECCSQPHSHCQPHSQ